MINDRFIRQHKVICCFNYSQFYHRKKNRKEITRRYIFGIQRSTADLERRLKRNDKRSEKNLQHEYMMFKTLSCNNFVTDFLNYHLDSSFQIIYSINRLKP